VSPYSYSLPSSTPQLPRLEGLIRLSEATAVGSFDGALVTMPAGEYFLGSANGAAQSFLEELADQIDAAIGSGTTTITLDAESDQGDGTITIGRTAAFDVVWTSATIRALLGFTGNLGSAASHGGTMHARHLWLPNCGREGGSMLGPESSSTTRYGRRVSDMTVSIAPTGNTKALAFSNRYVDRMSFAHVRGFKAWRELEQTPQESWEQFDEDVIAEGLWLRYYPDRSNVAIYQDWRVQNGGEMACEARDEGWRGQQSLWRVGPLSLLKRVD
jgi:hypothetical protein